MVEEVHKPGHPLIDKYSKPEGLVGRDIFCENLAYVDSRSSWGIQMADIVANTAYQAASNPSTGPHIALAKMLRGARGHPWNALHLYCLAEHRGNMRSSKLGAMVRAIEEHTGYRYCSWPDLYGTA
jgi:hypothetical protein